MGGRGREGLGEKVPQIGHEQRLFTEGGNACFPSFLLHIRPVIGGENDNGPVFSDHLSDTSDGFNPVHIRHKPVDDTGIELIARFHGMLCADHGFLPGNRPLRAHTDFRQHGRNAQTGIRILIRDKHPQSLQGFNFLIDLSFTGKPEGQADVKFTAA